ncbi:carbon-nitrogen hydrolase family protein [Piscinibacter sp.]|uniref:carbon-nitrogen hydrolase family protein n=1 Tax=Piscinibacter sp. TaxID=1903157 RepID=UPI002B725D49|nr:carbon-nitrogen hydrolase family protein [Albitalea sp.]HUG26304.1 carbon-nitrogen hydrolase family protein [Albitalea sp.]
MTRIAIVQKAPAFLDRMASLGIAVEAVAEAAAGGARLVVLPEAFIPGYPAWIWRLRPGADMALSERLHRALVENAVDLSKDDLAPIRDAAREHRVTVVCGINERDGRFSRGSLYNTVVTLGPDGSVLNRHRKLMPTNPERMVWGQGDATGLRSVDSACGRIGALICWENYMPLVRYALYAQGLDLYIAPTYDNGDRWIATLQHIAREAGCWVVGSGVAFRASDIRSAAPGLSELYPDADEWVNAGDSAVVAPGGAIVAGPLRNEQGLLYADIDRERIDNARRALDVTGHYARPDLFSLRVNNGPLDPVSFDAPTHP